MIFYISLVNEGANKAMASFKYMLCFFSICFLLCACNEENVQAPKEEATEQECASPKIQAELAGNLLEFNRDEVEIWIRNPDKNDKVYRYIDVSQDCSIQRVDNIFRIALGSDTFKLPMRLSLSMPDASNHDYLLGHLNNKTYSEIMLYYNDILEYRADGVIRISFVDDRKKERKYLIVEDKPQYSFNSEPIIFVCKKFQGCSTKYIHPLGFEVRLTINPFFKKSDVLGLLDVISSVLEQSLIKQEKRTLVRCKDKPIAITIDGIRLNVPRSFGVDAKNGKQLRSLSFNENCDLDVVDDVVWAGVPHLTIWSLKDKKKREKTAQDYIEGKWKKIQAARGTEEKLQDGVLKYADEYYDYYVLPIDILPTANDIPVLVSCPTGRVGRRATGQCEVYYIHPMGLAISYVYNGDLKYEDSYITYDRQRRDMLDDMIVRD